MEALSLFLSYNSDDRSSVIAVQRLLEALGVTTFLEDWPLIAAEHHKIAIRRRSG
jgi:hypothetical protein